MSELKSAHFLLPRWGLLAMVPTFLLYQRVLLWVLAFLRKKPIARKTVLDQIFQVGKLPMKINQCRHCCVALRYNKTHHRHHKLLAVLFPDILQGSFRSEQRVQTAGHPSLRRRWPLAARRQPRLVSPGDEQRGQHPQLLVGHVRRKVRISYGLVKRSTAFALNGKR